MKETLKAIAEYEKHAKALAHFMVTARLEISRKLREERREKHISLSSMAKSLGISKAYLSDVELNRRNVSSTLLEKLKKL